RFFARMALLALSKVSGLCGAATMSAAAKNSTTHPVTQAAGCDFAMPLFIHGYGMAPSRRGHARPYWQASQSGSSSEQAFGTGAASTAAVPAEATAFRVPVFTVDFSVPVAPRARR